MGDIFEVGRNYNKKLLFAISIALNSITKCCIALEKVMMTSKELGLTYTFWNDGYPLPYLNGRQRRDVCLFFYNPLGSPHLAWVKVPA